MKLVDVVNNYPDSIYDDEETIYVNTLRMGNGSVLDLNGYRLFFNDLEDNGGQFENGIPQKIGSPFLNLIWPDGKEKIIAERHYTITWESLGDVNDVIIDLRYNGGGLVSTANLLGDLLGGDVAVNLTFSKTVFNDLMEHEPQAGALLYRNIAETIAQRLRTTNELYRDSVAFGLESAGAAALNLHRLAEDLSEVTITLGCGGTIHGRLMQVDQNPLGDTLVLREADSPKLRIIPYHAVQTIDVGAG